MSGLRKERQRVRGLTPPTAPSFSNCEPTAPSALEEKVPPTITQQNIPVSRDALSESIPGLEEERDAELTLLALLADLSVRPELASDATGLVASGITSREGLGGALQSVTDGLGDGCIEGIKEVQ